jgi:uncharacterized membrane protein
MSEVASGTRLKGVSLRLRAEGDEARHLLASRTGRLLVAAVGALLALTLIGLLALWPYGWSPAGPQVRQTVGATVQSVKDASCGPGADTACRTIVADVSGRKVPLGLGPVANAPRVAPGDHVRLMKDGDPNASAQTDAYVHYEFAEVDRRGSLVWLGVVLLVAAAAVLRWRGVLAMLGVGVSFLLVIRFLVPAILAGRPAVLVALVTAFAVTFVTIGLTNGFGTQSLAAVLGVSATLALTCLMALAAVRFAHLDGTSELAMLSIKAGSQTLSLEGVILCAMIVGALGVLADTAVTQASAVMALRRANPAYGPRTLYREGFAVGRDHLSATIHTLVLAYAGAVLPLLLVLTMANVSTADVINGQSIAEPIVGTIVGCLGLIAAVPITTALSAMLVSRLPLDAVRHVHAHAH